MSYFVNENNISSFLISLSASFAFLLVIEISLFSIKNIGFIKLWIISHIQKPNKEIRLSISYLCRIVVDGKYLLVKNHKQNGFQPVGGVYKHFKEETSSIFESLSILPDTKMEINNVSRNDLRLILKQRKKLCAFLKWFYEKKDRELDPWREFREELIDTKILSDENFKYIEYSYIKTKKTNIKYSDYFEIDEFLQYDIFEIRLNVEQKTELMELLKTGNNEIIFATSDEISLCPNTIDKSRKIIRHTKFTL